MSAWWLPDDYLITHLWLPGLQSCLQFSCTHPKKNSFKILKTSSFYLTEGQPCIWYKVAKHQKEDSDVISCEELSSLKSLDLRGNRLTSLAEFRIPALKELYLSGNIFKMWPNYLWNQIWIWFFVNQRVWEIFPSISIYVVLKNLFKSKMTLERLFFYCELRKSATQHSSQMTSCALFIASKKI